MTDKAVEWLARAQADLLAAELLQRFEEYPTAVVAFHCQQAVEKGLKAFLTRRGIAFLFRHDLAYLLDLCTEADTAFADLEPQISGLTPYAVEARYPTDLPLMPSKSGAQAFYRQAQTVIEFVRGKLEEVGQAKSGADE